MENVSYKCIRKKEDSIKQCEIMYLQYEDNKPLITTFVAGHSFSSSLRVQDGMACTAGRLWRQCIQGQNWRMRGYRILWLNIQQLENKDNLKLVSKYQAQQETSEPGRYIFWHHLQVKGSSSFFFYFQPECKVMFVFKSGQFIFPSQHIFSNILRKWKTERQTNDLIITYMDVKRGSKNMLHTAKPN